MSQTLPPGSTGRPLELARQVDEACDRFEAACKTGQSPSLEDYLARVPPAERPAYLRELIPLEVEYRRRRGDVPPAHEYLQRFPDLDAEWLQGVLAGLPTGSEATEPTPPPPPAAVARQLRCPHCRSPIKLADNRSEEVLCPGCGSTFRVRDARDTLTVSGLRPLGKFQLLERVGVGTFGAVWRARDTELGRIVALKVLHTGLLSGPEELERFNREACLAAQLRHPSIVTVHEVANLEGLPVIVSEFIEGVTLRELLETRRLTFREAATLLAEVAEALHYAHTQVKGLVHRDVKPANIMVEYGRPGAADPAGIGKPLLVDFGLALRADLEVTMTMDGQLIGTPAYMSPEQAAGRAHEADSRSDVYSLGVVLYEMLCGELPFRGSQAMLRQQLLHDEPRAPRQLNDKIPRDLETICLKALAKEPARRYPSAGALAEDLRRYLRGEPILARPVGQGERLWRWCQRNPRVAVLAGTVLTLLVLLAVGSTTAALLIQRAWLRTREHAVEAEEQRRRARTNFKKALAALDLVTDTGQQTLEKSPHLAAWQRELLEKAAEFWQELAQEYLTNPAVKRESGKAYGRLGEIWHKLGNRRKARGAYDRAVTIFAELAATFPRRSLCRLDLAISHTDLGELLRTTSRRLRTAEGHYHKALDLLTRLRTEFPHRAAYQQELARAANNLGILLKDTSRFREAEQAYLRSIRLLERLVNQPPADAGNRAGLARGYLNLANLIALQPERRGEAERHYRRSIDLYEELRSEFPIGRDHQLKLALAYNGLGNLLAPLPGRQRDAETACTEAVKVCRTLTDDFPKFPLYQKELANSYNSLGSALWYAGRVAETEQHWGTALGLFRHLVKEASGVPEYEFHLGMILGNLGWLALDRAQQVERCQLALAVVPGDQGLLRMVLGRLGKAELVKARKRLEEAVTYHQAALDANPQSSRFRDLLLGRCQFLAEVLRRLGEPVAAARCQARRVSLIEQAPHLAAKDREQRAADGANQAVQLLREALPGKAHRAEDWAKDPDLAVLRGRAPFQALLNEARAQAARLP